MGAPGERAARALDELAARLFGGRAGQERLAPLAARFAREVGTFPTDEPWAESFVTLRLDWALTEVPVPGTPRTWAERVAAGDVPGIDSALGRACVETFASVFEVRAGRRTIATDCVGGTVVPLHGALFPAAEGAYFEVRVVAAPDGMHPVRRPEALPDEVGEILERMRRTALATFRRPSLDVVRRIRLALARNPRLPASLAVSASLGGFGGPPWAAGRRAVADSASAAGREGDREFGEGAQLGGQGGEDPG